MKQRFLLQIALAFALLLGVVAYAGRLLNLTGLLALDLAGRDIATLDASTTDYLKSLDAPLAITYFATARDSVQTLIGNELAMQKRINLSVQMPDDDKSVLPVHADVWSGDSAFEAVLWVPFVDVFASKSMFIASPAKNAEIVTRFKDFNGRSAEDLYREVEASLTFLEIPYGHVLVFNQNLMHGNRVNRESETRWSMNCRFKSVLSPYADKKLGEFFEPITLRAMTRIGMDFALPDDFAE